MLFKVKKVKRLQKTASVLVFASVFIFSGMAQATIVQFQTSLGDFEVNLYDEAAPATVANFLAYVEDDAYQNTIVHRLARGFVVQGGGYSYSGALPLERVMTNAPVENEPKYSNVRGSIAMAKLENLPDSATSQWFVNLSDNSANLDRQNGGFTVFGEVMGNGMDVVDAIAALPVDQNALPLNNYSEGEDFDADTHLVMVHNVLVLDAAVDTAADANPALLKKRKKSGALTGLMAMLLIGGVYFLRRKINRV